MTTPDGPDRGHQLRTYEHQPVAEGDSGTLVYDCDPGSEDGCFIRAPREFLGMPRSYVTEVSVPYFGDGGVRLLAHARRPGRAGSRTLMSDSSIHAGQAGYEHERQPDYGSGGPYRDGVGAAGRLRGYHLHRGRARELDRVFADRSAAEALADQHGGTFIEWTGRTGHVVTTADYDLELEA